MAVPEVLDLTRRFTDKTMVSLAQITLPVLPFAVGNPKASEKENTNLAAQIDRVPLWVLGRIL